MESINCKMCSSSDFLVDKDYQMCLRCYLHYEAHNPNVLKDFEQGLITKVEKNQIHASTVMGLIIY